MMRWKRDFGLGMGIMGAIVLSIFVFPPFEGGLGILAGFFIAKAVFQEDDEVLERKPE